MPHAPIATFDKPDRGDVATAVLGTLVAALSAAILLLLYLPVR